MFADIQFPNYSKAKIICDSIINSGLYSLESNQTNIYSNGSPENIYSINNPKLLNADISVQKTILPICRISEVYLTYSYSAMGEGDVGGAINQFQIFQEGKGDQISDIYDPDALKEKLKEYWLSEFVYDGLRFATLKKFELTNEILGLPDYMKLLPIPMKELNYNPNIVQNPGY